MGLFTFMCSVSRFKLEKNRVECNIKTFFEEHGYYICIYFPNKYRKNWSYSISYFNISTEVSKLNHLVINEQKINLR